VLFTAKIKIQWLHYETSVLKHDGKKRYFCKLVIRGNITIDIKVCVCAIRTQPVQDNILHRNILNMLMEFPFYCIPTLVSYCI
jgi:hypothetical protein